MDRTEANVEAKKIFDKWNEKTNEIEKKAELAELESQIYEMKKVEK